ncbi:MAG: protein-disulfide reductase DsbD family protein [Betaproteobacteria bacterium]
MQLIRTTLAASAALLAFALPVDAQPVRGDNIESEIVAETTAIVPGQPLNVALRLKHDPHWHTYWQVPGDSGLPTTINWKLPEGWSAGPIQWPVPQRLAIGPLMNFGYEGEILLLTRLTPPASLKPGDTVTLEARADWLICKDVCIPGGADLKLPMTVLAQVGPSRFAPQFAVTRTLVPGKAAVETVQATIEANRIKLAFTKAPGKGEVRKAEFFPLQEARIEPPAPQVLQSEGNAHALYLRAAQPIAADFKQLAGVLVVNGGPANAAQGGWAGTVDVPLVVGTVATVGGASAANPATTIVTEGAAASIGFWGAVIGALIGGLILNLMPCVFPVLSLKLLSLMQHQRQEDAAHVKHAASLRAHGGAFAAGVILSFVLLAGLLIALRAGGAQLGWGFQLQTPWVVAALATLFFLIGLNLLGTFEFNLGSGVASSDLAQKLQSDSLSGSFWTGVLAVVVAAPCTAPFMGAALGYAATQPAAIALTVFAMLGVGMAAPYVTLTLFPKLLAKLPRPGVWMERFKQIMAFPMFATVVWLVWVLAQQTGANGVAWALGACVLVGMAAWAFGLMQRGSKGFRWVAAAAAALGVYALFAGTGPGAVEQAQAVQRSTNAAAGWQPWSTDEVNKQLAAGKPVFVDFTAAWCVTCQVNKQTVLQTASLDKAFDASGVVRMRADWTNRDEAITRELARFNRNGVPLYVLFDPKGTAHVLPELLTERTVIDALSRLDRTATAQTATTPTTTR